MIYNIGFCEKMVKDKKISYEFKQLIKQIKDSNNIYIMQVKLEDLKL